MDWLFPYKFSIQNYFAIKKKKKKKKKKIFVNRFSKFLPHIKHWLENILSPEQ